MRIARPRGHVFQVYGAREAREVFRIVLGATGPDLFRECLRQIASKHAARCQIGDAKHQTVVRLDVEERLVLGVRADVHVERHVARYGRHVEGRAEQPLESRLVRRWRHRDVVRVHMERGVGGRAAERVARRPRNVVRRAVRASDVHRRPSRRQGAWRDSVKVLGEQLCRLRLAGINRIEEHRRSFFARHVQHQLDWRACNEAACQLQHVVAILGLRLARCDRPVLALVVVDRDTGRRRGQPAFDVSYRRSIQRVGDVVEQRDFHELDDPIVLIVIVLSVMPALAPVGGWICDGDLSLTQRDLLRRIPSERDVGHGEPQAWLPICEADLTGRRVGGEELVLPRNRLVVVAQVRLTRVVPVSRVERARRQRHRLAPRQTAVVRVLPRHRRDIAARVDVLVVIEHVHAPGRGVDRHPWKPLCAIFAGAAVQVDRRRERHTVVHASLKHDVGAVERVVVAVDDVHIAAMWAARRVDRQRRAGVHAIVTENLIGRRELARQLGRLRPRRAVVGGTGEGDLVDEPEEREPRPRNVRVVRAASRKRRNGRLAVLLVMPDDSARRPRRRCRGHHVIGVGR